MNLNKTVLKLSTALSAAVTILACSYWSQPPVDAATPAIPLSTAPMTPELTKQANAAKAILDALNKKDLDAAKKALVDTPDFFKSTILDNIHGRANSPTLSSSSSNTSMLSRSGMNFLNPELWSITPPYEIFERAIFLDQKDFVELFVQYGADPNYYSSSRVSDESTHQPLLYEAISNGSTEIVRFLYDHGADPLAKSKSPENVIYGSNAFLSERGSSSALEAEITANKPKPEILQIVLAHGADLNSPLPGKNSIPIVEAVLNSRNAENDVNTIYIIDHIKKPSAIDQAGMNAVYLAAGLNRPAILKELIKRGCSVNIRTSDGKTPIFNAISSQLIDNVKFLINHGANVSIASESHQTPLIVCEQNAGFYPNATSYQKKNAAKLRLSFRSPLNQKEIVPGKDNSVASASMNTNSAGSSFPATSHEAILRSLMQRHPSETAVDDYGLSAFDYAVISRDATAVALLDPSKTVSGDLFKAITSDDPQRISKALTANPSLLSKRYSAYGYTLLEVAALWDAKKCATLLIKAGADVNAQDGLGQTPLHWACRNPKAADMTQMLVERGAYLNNADKSKRTPIALAVGSDAFSSVKYLVGKQVLENNDQTGYSLLDLVSGQDEAAITSLLLDYGVQPSSNGNHRPDVIDMPDSSKYSNLYLRAIYASDLDLITVLYHHKIPSFFLNDFPLDIAISTENLDSLEQLLKLDASDPAAVKEDAIALSRYFYAHKTDGKINKKIVELFEKYGVKTTDEEEKIWSTPQIPTTNN